MTGRKEPMAEGVEPIEPRHGKSYVLAPLAPPIIWIIYFMAVYLYAELGCAFGWGEPVWFGLHGVAVVTVLTTVVALGVTFYYTVISWRRFAGAANARYEQMARSLGLLGLLSGGMFIVATLLVGLPAVLFPPC